MYILINIPIQIQEAALYYRFYSALENQTIKSMSHVNNLKFVSINSLIIFLKVKYNFPNI